MYDCVVKMLVRMVTVCYVLGLASCCKEATTCLLPDGNIGLCHLKTCIKEVVVEPRQDLQFTITVRYPESVMLENGWANLFIRGNGLGMTWKNGIRLSKSVKDTWAINITYMSHVRGYTCQKCGDMSRLPDNKLQYRILIDDRLDMKGPNFAIKFPISQTSLYFAKKPEFVVYPWFKMTTGRLESFNVSSHLFSGDKNISIYTPPSFTENTYKIYDTILVFDLSYEVLTFFKRNLEDPINQSVSEEYVLIGFGDYKDDTERTDLLTPVKGQYPTCYNGTLENYCDGCIPVTDNITEMMYYYNLCTYGKLVGGSGDQTLDFLLYDVLPAAEKFTGFRIERSRLGIMGYSLGGLMACYAGWTRPALFSSAICQSSSFFWPHDSVTNTASFHFINQTLKNSSLLANRPRQKFYIDAGGLENFDPYRLTQSAIEVGEFLARLENFALNDNVWIAVEPGRAHGMFECGRRIGQAIAVVLSAGGDPSLLGTPADRPTSACNRTHCQPMSLVILLFVGWFLRVSV